MSEWDWNVYAWMASLERMSLTGLSVHKPRHRDRELKQLSTYIKYLLCARQGITCDWRGYCRG